MTEARLDEVKRAMRETNDKRLYEIPWEMFLLHNH